MWERNTKWYEDADVAEDVQVAVFLGLRGEARRYLARCKELEIPCIIVDLGWLRRERGYWQVSVGELNVPPPIAPNASRFLELQLKVRDVVQRDYNTLIVGQVPGDAQHDLTDGSSVIKWGRSVAEEIRERYGRRKIFWRPHPGFLCRLGPPAITTLPDKTVHEAIADDNVGSAVVYNSTLGLELLRQGVRVVAMGPRTVYSDLVPSCISELKTAHPGATRVRALLERCAYGQYKLDELNWSTLANVLALHGITGDW